MRSFLLLFFSFCVLASDGLSQGYFNNWYFGTNAGITFNSGSPIALVGGMTNHLEGTACISDVNGNLLFYTDGITVWNRNHVAMPNGTGLGGNWSTAQSALIVPFPGSSSKYYVFTLTDWMGNGNLTCSIVDMTLSNGLGDIIVGQKNLLIGTNLTEKLVSASASGCGVWVLTHQRNNNRFEARLINNNGIGAPVYSDAGAVHYSVPIPPTNYNALTGVMKVSKNNQKVAVATLSQINEVFDFDPATGQVSNPISLPISYPKQGYGICFSPDNTKVYATEGNSGSPGFDIYQFDISSNSAAVVSASKKFVGRATTPIVIVGDLQIGPDDKIYIARQGTSSLAVIPSPDQTAPACGFINNGASLGSKLSNSGLANEIRLGSDLSVAVDLGKDTAACPGTAVTLTAPPSFTYYWSTGATTQTINVSTSGKYWVQVSNGQCSASDTILVSLDSSAVNLGPDTALCSGNQLLLNARKGFQSYTWQDGSTDSIFTVAAPGLYYVTVTNACGFISKDSVIVTLKTATIDIGPDKQTCNGDTLVLTAPTGFLNYSWSNNYNINSLSGPTGSLYPLVDTAYYIKAEKTLGCFAYDTLRVYVYQSPLIDLGVDQSLCSGDSLVLNAETGFASYVWSNGSSNQQISVTAAGAYSIIAITQEGCTSRDSINLLAVNPLPQVSLDKKEEMCAGDSKLLDAGNFTSYLWQDGSTSPTLQVNAAGTYWVRVTDSNGCSNTDTSMIKTVHPVPVDFLPHDTTICSYGSIVLAPSTSFKTYQWNTGSTTPSVTVTQPGLYSLQVEDMYGCKGAAAIIVSLKDCIKGFFVPTAFTPNSDRKNDRFRPMLFGKITQYRFTVYNRWGQVVFHSTKPEEGWDGNLAGAAQATFVFVWTCSYQFEGEPLKNEKGTVTLIR